MGPVGTAPPPPRFGGRGRNGMGPPAVAKHEAADAGGRGVPAHPRDPYVGGAYGRLPCGQWHLENGKPTFRPTPAAASAGDAAEGGDAAAETNLGKAARLYVMLPQ